MKKILAALLLLFVAFPVFAQEEVLMLEEDSIVQVEDQKTGNMKSSNQYFELELKKGTQSPINKSIPFTVYITPKIDSSKTQILWNTSTVFDISKSHKEFESLKKGETYSFSATFSPKKAGSYDITVNVISWQFDSNKSNSVNYHISLNDSLVLQPVDTMYTIYIGAMILGILLLCIGIILLIRKGITLLTKKAKSWFTPPY